jgi:hypothetical protein
LFLLSRTSPQENPNSGWFLMFLVASFGCLLSARGSQDPTRHFAVIHVWISWSVSPFQRCQGSSRCELFLAWCKWLNAIWCWRNDSGWMDSSDVCLTMNLGCCACRCSRGVKDLLGGSVFCLSNAILGADYLNPGAGCLCLLQPW